MKSKLVATLLIVFLAAGCTQKVGAEDISVSVTSIETNSHVRGRVSGLTDGKAQAYKVLVYVHTDVWYLHPYTGQGQGKSWAPIDDEGRWEIQTVQREFAADQLAVLVVKMGTPEVAKAESLLAIPAEARTVMTLRGTANFGRL